MAREVELISDRDLARKRLPIWMGSDMPQTIVMKELIDNEIDVVSERTQSATEARIKIAPNRLKLMDNGSGISTEIKEGTDKTNLWLACAKMFTSSNYEGVSDSVGANGVGLSMANFTSSKFTIMNINGKNVKGYQFSNGFLNGTEESKVEETGDNVNNPFTFEEAKEKFDPMFDRGFLVDVTWDPTPNDLFEDSADINWLVDYAMLRTGEIVKGEIRLEVYADNNFETLVSSSIWNKDPKSSNYVMSWDERVKNAGGVIIKDGNWQIGLSTDQSNFNIRSIVQGAPVRSQHSTNMNIKIQDEDIRVSVPVTFKYQSTDYPNYTDQTKVAVRFPYSQVGRSFEKTISIYNHFYKEAEKLYMKKVIKGSEQGSLVAALGRPEDGELLIAEGFSAGTTIRNVRNNETQSCIALRGKISNTWNLDMAKAMRSDVVKQILNAVMNYKYKRILIAVDADTHGLHIASLLIALFVKFTPELIKENKIKVVKTPKYIFKKRKSPFKWSDNANDCPAGYSVTTLKGLGGMTAAEAEVFITNPDTRTLVDLKWDDQAEESLTLAFSEGAESWIVKDKEDEKRLKKINKMKIDDLSNGITVTEYIHTFYREYWSYSNKDGKNSVSPREQLPEVVRKIIYSAYKLNIRPYVEVRTPGLSGETIKIHPHSQDAINDSIAGLASSYKSEPAMRLLEGIGNFGVAAGSGEAASRYTSIAGTPLLSSIYKDIPFLPMSYDDTGVEQPDYISMPIPIAVIGGTSPIGTGRSCYIAERKAKDVINWIKDLNKNKWDASKVKAPDATSSTGCKTWLNEDNGYTYYEAIVHYGVDMRDITKKGKYDIITALPPKSTSDFVISKLLNALPTRAKNGIIDGQGKGKPTYIIVPQGYLNPKDFNKYGLRNARIERVFTWDQKLDTMRHSSVVDVLKEWFEDRCDVVSRRLNKSIDDLDRVNTRIDLTKMFSDNNMQNWKSEDIVSHFEKEFPDKGEEYSSIVLSLTTRAVLPENLEKNKVLKEKNLEKIGEISSNIKNIHEFVIQEAFDIIKAQEEFFAEIEGA